MISRKSTRAARGASFLIFLGVLALGVWLVASLAASRADARPASTLFTQLAQALWLVEAGTLALCAPVTRKKEGWWALGETTAMVLVISAPFWGLVGLSGAQTANQMLKAHAVLVVLVSAGGVFLRGWEGLIPREEWRLPGIILVQSLGIALIFLHNQALWAWIES